MYKDVLFSHNLSEGSVNSSPFQIVGSNPFIELHCNAGVTGTVKAKLEIASNSVSFQEVEDTEVSIDTATTQISWALGMLNLPSGIFVRIAITADGAATGIFTRIKILTNE